MSGAVGGPAAAPADVRLAISDSNVVHVRMTKMDTSPDHGLLNT